jgi:hypothetical protein
MELYGRETNNLCNNGRNDYRTKCAECICKQLINHIISFQYGVVDGITDRTVNCAKYNLTLFPDYPGGYILHQVMDLKPNHTIR